MLHQTAMEPALIGAEAATRLGRGISDEQLLERVRAGDAAFFEVFVRRFNARVFRVARAIVRDDAVAEDVMQETYLQAFTHLHQFEGRSSLATWLTRIAVNEAIARRRRIAREPVASALDQERQMDVSTTDDPERAAHQAEVLRVVARLVDDLPEPLRVVFVLRIVEGMSVAEAAAALELSEENIKVRLFRARAQLKDKLDGAFEDASAELFAFHLVRCDRVVRGVLSGLARRGLDVPVVTAGDA